MPKTALKITGVKALRVALDPVKFDKILKVHMRQATAFNGKMGEAAMRKLIQSGLIAPKNAALTSAIKGDSKVLVDDSTLFGNITSKVVSDTEAFVGVLRTSGAFNVAVGVHEGVTIAVTTRMRGMFFLLWQASTGGLDPSKLEGRAAELFERFQDWKPLAPGTSSITIPARRWVPIVFRDPALKKQAKENWQKAMKAAFKDVARLAKG